MAVPMVVRLAGQTEDQSVDLTVVPKVEMMVGCLVEAKAVTKAA